MTPQEIAAGLTKAQREAVLSLSGDYRAGPELPEESWDELKALQHGGLCEREFLDWRGEMVIRDGEYKRWLSACWWYRLTPLGLQVRAILAAQ